MIDTFRRNAGPIAKKLKLLLRNRLFVATTVIPTGIALLYFGLIAADIYVSESRFVVRSPERQSPSTLGMLLKGTGFSRDQGESYSVQDYMLSRDALKALDEELHLANAFREHGDVFSRFPGLDWDDSFEALYLYYQKKIGVQLDSASSITTLTTRAFTAEDAFEINRKLLDQAEALVNQLNQRAREDMIRFASNEVAEAQKKARAAELMLSNYRNTKGVIDPEKQAELPLKQIAALQDELVTTKIQISQLENIARENPQLPVLRQRVGILERAIDEQTSRVAGGGERSLAGKAAEYQRLAIEREFTQKMLASAMATLEEARNDAIRKQLYIERIVQPIKPDNAMEPRRIKGVIAVFSIGLVMFGILSMLLAGIREHLD